MRATETTAGTTTMRAITHHRYGTGDVLGLSDVAKPVPGDDQVLIRVRGASVNPYDWHFATGLPYVIRPQFGMLRPKDSRLGADLAGVVEAVGRSVTRYHIGDEVYGLGKLGSHAEYVCAAESTLAPRPENLTFEEAAAVPMGGLTALQGLRDVGQVQPGQSVLINGASGGVGTFAVQLGKWFGAEVTGVCSTRNVEMIHSLGADHVVDYTKEDFTSGPRRYDLIFDLIGNRSASQCRRALNPGGMFVASFGQPENLWIGPFGFMIRMRALSVLDDRKMVLLSTKPNTEDLEYLTGLIEAGTVKPVIDRLYPLAEVPDAVDYLALGHARGKVVIAV